MKRISLLAILFIGCIQLSYAQTEAVTDVKKEKTWDHYMGVQLNGLIRQVFNFNNSTSGTDVNPYLLNYSMNSKKSGWGIRAGVGYTYNSKSDNDGITESIIKINDLQLRIGVEKAFKLSDRWSVGAGLDGVFNSNDDKTTTTIHSFDTTVTDSKTTITSYGGGPMAWLRFHITPKILVGTEASFYYVTGTQKNTVDITNKLFDPNPPSGQVITTTETISKPTVDNGSFTSPVVFYLIVKF